MKILFFSFNVLRNLIYIQISGTASKLGRPNAYHHCTLLVNCNRELMSNLLRKREVNCTINNY